MKRTPLQRRTPLARGASTLRRTDMKRTPMKRVPRKVRPDKDDSAYIEFIRALACCAPGCRAQPRSDAHHKTGAGLALREHDHKTMPLCRRDHESVDLLVGRFDGWSREQRAEWQDGMICTLRALYVALFPLRAAENGGAMPVVFYFGCWSESQTGHYIYRPGGDSTFKPPELPPRLLPRYLDGAYCYSGRERGHQPLGAALIHHVFGWTVMAFWDRSADQRPGSNAAFLAEGEHDFDTMCRLAGEHFPSVWQRITTSFDVVHVEAIVIEAPGSIRIDGCPDAVHGKLQRLGDEWQLVSIELGFQQWDDFRKRFPAFTGVQGSISGVGVVRGDSNLKPELVRARLRLHGSPNIDPLRAHARMAAIMNLGEVTP